MAIAAEVSPGEHGLQDGDGWRGDGDGGDDRPEMIRAELVRRLSPLSLPGRRLLFRQVGAVGGGCR